MAVIRRLLCRVFGHREHYTQIRRGKIVAVVVGCTRCDQILALNDKTRLPRMTVPKG